MSLNINQIYNLQNKSLAESETDYATFAESTGVLADKIFKSVWKLSGSPSHIDRILFGKQACLSHREVVQQALSLHLAKATETKLSIALDLVQTKNRKGIQLCLDELRLFNPSVVELIETNCPSLFSEGKLQKNPDFSLLELEILRVFTAPLIEIIERWVNEAPEETGRAEIASQIKVFCTSPLEDRDTLSMEAVPEAWDAAPVSIASLPDIFKHPVFRDLETLAISGYGCKTLRDLSHLSKLKNLDLKNNKLTVIPDLSSLTELTFLNLAENELTEFPRLPGSLTDLDAERNNLTNIAEVDNLPNLERLILNSNSLTEINLNIVSLHMIESIELRNNNLIIPDSFRGLNQLTNGIYSSSSVAVLLEGNTEWETVFGKQSDWPNFLRKRELSLCTLNETINDLFNDPVISQLPFFFKLPIESLNLLNQWIREISEKLPTYPSDSARQDTKNFVRHFLDLAERNPEFRSLFFGVITETQETPTCIDGLTLSLIHLHEAELSLGITPANPLAALAPLTQVIICEFLNEIAEKKIQDLKLAIDISIANGTYVPTSDQEEYGPHISIQRVEREIRLIYLVNLKEALHLSFPLEKGSMVFGAITPVTGADLTEALESTQSMLSNSNLFHSKLIAHPAWQTTLKLHLPREFRSIDQQDTLTLEERNALLIALSRRLAENSETAPIPPQFMPLLEDTLKLSMGASGDLIAKLLADFAHFKPECDLIALYNEAKDPTDPPLIASELTSSWRPIDSLLLLALIKEQLLTPIEEIGFLDGPSKRRRT